MVRQNVPTRRGGSGLDDEAANGEVEEATGLGERLATVGDGDERGEHRQLQQLHDLVVVFLHWGLDYQACPDTLSRQTAEVLEAAGADVVVGGHSHRVNGAGWLGRSYVAYGLGNFVWWRSREPDSRTGVLTLTVDVERARGKGTSTSASSPAVTKARWTPMLVGADGIPRQPARADRQRLMAVWKQAAGCSGLTARP